MTGGVLSGVAAWGILLLAAAAPLPAVRALVFWLARVVPGASRARRTLVALVSWALLESAVTLLLGATGHLDRLGIVVAEACVAAAGLALLAALRGRRAAPEAAAEDHAATSWAEGIVAAVLGAEGVAVLWALIVRPVTEYDSLAYHLPTIARWLQEARFVPFEQFAHDAVASYPFTWEAVSALLVVPLRSDLFVALPSFLAWGVLGVAVWALAARLGAARDAALASTLLLLNVPLLLDQTFAVRSDVALAAFFVAALELAWWYHDTSSPVVAALAFACACLACAVKVSGPGYALALAAVFAALAAARRLRAGGGRPVTGGGSWAVAAAIIAVAAGVGAFWYARNFVLFGSPLGTLAGAFPGTTAPAAAPGPAGGFAATTLVHLFDPADPGHWLILGKTVAFYLGVPFVAIAALATFSLGGRRRGPWLVAATGVLAFGLYLVTPNTGDAGDHGFRITTWIGQAYRYGFSFVAVVAVLAALGATRLGLTGARFLPLAAGAVGAALARPAFRLLMRGQPFKINSWAGLRTYLLAGLLAAAVVAGAALLLRVLEAAARRGGWSAPRALRSRTTRRWAAAVVGAVALLLAAVPGRAARENGRRNAYGGIPECLALLASADERVGYVYTHRAYQLFGSDLSRRTRFLGAAERDPADGWSGAGWVASLRAERVGLVAVGPLLPEWQGARELAVLQDPRGSFARACGGDPHDEMVVYRLAP